MNKTFDGRDLKMGSVLAQTSAYTRYFEGQPHEFTSSWPQVMRRTVEFFDKYLKS